jgi:hypothetical protein
MTYPKAADHPVASNFFSAKEYLNRSKYRIDNQRVSVLQAQKGIGPDDKQHIAELAASTCIMLHSYTVAGKSFTEAVGTGLLVNESQIITAKHTLTYVTGSTLYVGFNYNTKDGSGDLFKLTNIEAHYLEDIAVVTLSGCPGIVYNPVNIHWDEQPLGEYWVCHHAGGFPCMLSIGEFPDHGGHQFQYEQELLIHAGSGASGAGIFSSKEHFAVGIMYYRSIGYCRVSRKTVLFANVRAWLISVLAKPNMLRQQISVAIKKSLYYRPYRTLKLGHCIPINNKADNNC